MNYNDLMLFKNFAPEDVTVSPGVDIDAVVIDCYIQPVDSVEKNLYHSEPVVSEG